MKSILSLLYTDIVFLKNWFKKESISKIIVAVSFLAIFLLLFLFLYFFSLVFFKNLLSFEKYGQATAYYLIHASLILILWFAITSSVVATFNMLLSYNKNSDYLLTQPIKSSVLVIWYSLRSVAMNSFLLFIVVSPFVISYEQVFIKHISPVFIGQYLFIIISLVAISVSFGGAMAFIIALFIPKIWKFAAIIGIILFLLFTYVLVQLIFPPELSALYNVSAENFFTVYSKLPLVSYQLPTKMIIDILFSGFTINSLYFSSGIISCVLFSLYFQNISFFRIIQDLKDKSAQKSRATLSDIVCRIGKTNYPLVYKNWYSAIRSPRELGYGIFLLSLIFFFFIFLWRGMNQRYLNPVYKNDILLFSFVWFVFFTVSYLLRLVFPLMAEEGDAIWHIFTLPIARDYISRSILITGILFTLPLFILSFILWLFLPIASGNILILTLFCFISVLLNSVMHSLLGIVHPNFRESHDPEKVSTSSMGLLALFISVICGFILYLPLKLIIYHELSPAMGIGLSSLGCSFIILITYILAKHSINHYNFES